MKKRIGIIAVVAVALAFGTGAVAKEVFETIKAQIRQDFVIEIDGVKREFENANGERVHPILHEGTTYLPVRAISEIMGKTVYWYEAEKKIVIKDEKDAATTVTDADVIISSGEKDAKIPAPKSKEEKPAPEKTIKEDKVKDVKVTDDKVKEDKLKAEKVYDDTGFIGKEKAKEIALSKAGLKEADVSFIKVEFEKEKGIFVYDVEFQKDRTEYSAEIKGEDGTIIDWEVDFDD